MNVQKIKEQLRTKTNAVEELMPKVEEPEEVEEEDHDWSNPEYTNAVDYEFGEDGNGNAERIIESLKDENIDYKSKKSMSQFREFFYDLAKTYEKFENNQ